MEPDDFYRDRRKHVDPGEESWGTSEDQEAWRKAVEFLPHATEAARRAVAKHHGIEPHTRVHILMGPEKVGRVLDWNTETRQYDKTNKISAAAEFGWRNPDKSKESVRHWFPVNYEGTLGQPLFHQKFQNPTHGWYSGNPEWDDYDPERGK